MAIDEQVLVDMVEHVSEHLKNPEYSQLAVGNFVQLQPDVSRYLSAYAGTESGGESLVQAVFHLELLRQCFERAHGRPPPTVTFSQLDSVYDEDSLKRLSKKEPAIANYVVSNIETVQLRDLVAHVAVAFSTAMGIPSTMPE